jgi:hypothetical protein
MSQQWKDFLLGEKITIINWKIIQVRIPYFLKISAETIFKAQFYNLMMDDP